MSKRDSTTREARAQALLNTGAVSLFVGQGYALVQGSGSNVYRVTKDGCTCPDAAQRGRPAEPARQPRRETQWPERIAEL